MKIDLNRKEEIDMIITEPKIEDYVAINNIALQVHNSHVKWAPDFFSECNEIITKDDFADMLQKHSVFVAKINNEIVGYMYIIIKVKDQKGFTYRKQLDIDSICVDEKYRNQGIGTAMINYIKEYATNINCTHIALNVNPENTNAIHFYEKIGMKIRHIAYSMQLDN